MPQVQYQELTKVDRMWHLSRSGLFGGLSLADLRAILSVCTDRIYSTGEIIFDQGDPADSVFILNRGCVRISLLNLDDREKILDMCSMGILGENLLTSSQRFNVRAMAHEESWVSIICREKLHHLIHQRPSIALNYATVLSQRLLEAREQIKCLSFLDTERRLGRMLLRLAERYGTPMVGDRAMVKLRIHLSHKQMARLVGTDRSYLSTIMSRFKRKGWVNCQKRNLLINQWKIKEKA